MWIVKGALRAFGAGHATAFRSLVQNAAYQSITRQEHAPNWPSDRSINMIPSIWLNKLFEPNSEPNGRQRASQRLISAYPVVIPDDTLWDDSGPEGERPRNKPWKGLWTLCPSAAKPQPGALTGWQLCAFIRPQASASRFPIADIWRIGRHVCAKIRTWGRSTLPR